MSKVYFYYSAMNAGKSTVLLQSSYNYQERGMNTLVFAPALDSRAGESRFTHRTVRGGPSLHPGGKSIHHRRGGSCQARAVLRAAG